MSIYHWVRTRRSLFIGLMAGIIGGGSLSLAALYKRTGKDALSAVGRKMGLVDDANSLFLYGHDSDKDLEEDWGAVLSPTHPNWKVRRGFDVELVAEGLDYPINMVFVEKPGTEPDSPIFYVNELHGAVKYVGRDGKIRTFADKLINFTPMKIEKSDEAGLSGLSAIPGSEDLLVTGSYKDPVGGLLSNRILRLRSEPGGKKLSKIETVLDLKEFTAPSNQIQQVLVGPDGKLYVSVGDAENHALSLDLNRFGGKILRMNLDGSACEDNPYYSEGAPSAPKSYVFASGVRNVFDIDFAPSSGRLYGVDNGKNVDRFFEIIPGGVYGWNGDFNSTRINSLYTWGPEKNIAPVGLSFLKAATGPASTTIVDRAYTAGYGPAARLGPNHSKKIVELTLDAKGLLIGYPRTVVQYNGPNKATVLGLAEGADGMYFTDFWGETTSSDDAKGRIYKLVTSKKTLGLPSIDEAKLAQLPPLERGRHFFSKNCTPCHTIDGFGGTEGPELTHVLSNLERRLGSSGYTAELDQLIKSDNQFLTEQKSRLTEVRSAKGSQRIEVWLHHHLEEPRFDYLYAKMPSFAQALPVEQRKDIIAYLMTRK